MHHALSILECYDLWRSPLATSHAPRTTWPMCTGSIFFIKIRASVLTVGERKNRYKMKNSAWNQNPWSDIDNILHRGRYPWHNHLCKCGLWWVKVFVGGGTGGWLGQISPFSSCECVIFLHFVYYIGSVRFLIFLVNFIVIFCCVFSNRP